MEDKSRNVSKKGSQNCIEGKSNRKKPKQTGYRLWNSESFNYWLSEAGRMYHGKCIRAVVYWSSPTWISNLINSVCIPVTLCCVRFIFGEAYISRKRCWSKRVSRFSQWITVFSKECLCMFPITVFVVATLKVKITVVDGQVIGLSCIGKW